MSIAYIEWKKREIQKRILLIDINKEGERETNTQIERRILVNCWLDESEKDRVRRKDRKYGSNKQGKRERDRQRKTERERKKQKKERDRE